jgi:threonine dehydratase
MEPQMSDLAVSRADVEAAAARIRGHVRRTPVIEIAAEDFGLTGGPILFKLEFLQHSGSFKARGAFNSLMSQPVPAAGVVAASGGNHGAAVAFAAGRLGIAAHIFVPEAASPAKIAQIRSYGAALTITGALFADAAAAAEKVIAETGALRVHPFDQPGTMQGQGTVAMEFAEQASPDTILVATGGGGLIAGMAAWAKGSPRLVSVEPETAPTLHMAMAAGGPVEAPAGGVAADSLAPRQVGALVYPLCAAHVAQTVLVPDAAIRAAQKKLWEVLRVVAEPGGATAFAALLSGLWRPEPDERLGVLLCGANTTAVDFGK